MPLYVKDPEVDELATRLSSVQRLSKTEAVRRALLHELQRAQAEPSLVERGVEFARALRERAPRDVGQPADKDFIDSLYDEP